MKSQEGTCLANGISLKFYVAYTHANLVIFMIVFELFCGIYIIV